MKNINADISNHHYINKTAINLSVSIFILRTIQPQSYSRESTNGTYRYGCLS